MPDETEGSFWQGLADNAPAESPQYEELPEGAWVLLRTADETNGKAAPEVRVSTTGKGDELLKFNLGLLAVGGDAKLDAAKHQNSTVFMDFFVRPGEKELQHQPGKALGGRLTGFLNAIFAGGVAADEKDEKVRSTVRWRKTIAELSQRSGGLTPDQYQGDMPVFIAAVAAQALKNEPRTLLGKTKREVFDRKDGGKGSKVVVGSFEDATEANMKKRSVVEFPAKVAF
jgi:hypothetical protein